MFTSLWRLGFRYRWQRACFFQAERKGTPEYRDYFFRGGEQLLYLFVSGLAVGFLAFFFYRSFWALLPLMPVGAVVYFSLERGKGERRRRKLEAEFRDCIQLVAANLRAGYSVENAFCECERDMKALYGERGLMGGELARIKKGLGNNMTLEQLLGELGERSSSDHIREFSEVFAIGRLYGGNLPEIIQTTAGQIAEEISLKQEISATISGKQFEQNIMTVIPFCMMGYIEITNSGFFGVLYHNTVGYVIMTVSLAVYLTAYGMGRQICRHIGQVRL